MGDLGFFGGGILLYEGPDRGNRFRLEDWRCVWRFLGFFFFAAG